MSQTDDLIALGRKVLFNNYNRQPVVMSRGQGCVLWDLEGRRELVAFENSFHGPTMGALSVTGQPKYRQGFGPLVPGVKFIPFGDLAAVRAAVTDKTCALITEPLQAEGGLNMAPPGYLAEPK